VSKRRTSWWASGVIMLALLAFLDGGLRLWHPLPSRLPENFSAAYLSRVLGDLPRSRGIVVLAGDSAVWGYHVSKQESLGARLAALLVHDQVLNVSIQGGSPVNTYVALTEVLRRGIHPRLVIFNLNLKEFSPEDRSYQRILPALAPAAHQLSAADRRDFLFQEDHQTRLARAVERIWLLYRYRDDIRQAVFGDADLASRLASAAAALSGRAEREAERNAPTADKYFGAYDLSPLATDNTSLRYTRETLALLRSHNIPTLVYLTPTNHGLLHDTIDAPEYDANLKELMAVVRSYGMRAYNFDRSFPQNAFIDNDHLRAPGLSQLARQLAALAV